MHTQAPIFLQPTDVKCNTGFNSDSKVSLCIGTLTIPDIITGKLVSKAQVGTATTGERRMTT